MRTSNAKTPPDVAASNARDRVPVYWMWLVLLGLRLPSSPLWAAAPDWAPAHVKATGQADSPLLKLGVLDVTLYNGWEGHAVDPTGEKDSTKALQKAIEDARDSALVVFFPSGTYKVSDTLNCMKKAWIPQSMGSRDTCASALATTRQAVAAPLELPPLSATLSPHEARFPEPCASQRLGGIE
jgi:hypothetical protein